MYKLQMDYNPFSILFSRSFYVSVFLSCFSLFFLALFLACGQTGQCNLFAYFYDKISMRYVVRQQHIQHYPHLHSYSLEIPQRLSLVIIKMPNSYAPREFPDLPSALLLFM